MTDPEMNLQIARLAPSGHHLALRVRLYFPSEEKNALPKAWVDYYTEQKLLFEDPSLRWAYHNSGVARWSSLASDDPAGMITASARFGMRFGAVAAIADRDGLRSYGTFFRPDREYAEIELSELLRITSTMHSSLAPPTSLTKNEIIALRAIKNGRRVKVIAHDLGISEGAVKQRLKNARAKLGASTGTQAAAMASDYGLL